MIDASGLVPITGSDRLNQDPSYCALYSEDISGSAAIAADAIVRAADVEMVQAVIRWARSENVAVVARGGGMSYTGGYTPQRPGTILLDLRELCAVGAIDSAASSVSVEAGCTWAALYDALAEKNLRVPFFGPLSGSVATIGGAIAQNGAFFGSAAHGFAADQVIGLELVDGHGELRRLGAVRSDQGANYGPELMKLMVADGGAFGVKTAVALRTMTMPSETQFASYSFDQSAAVVTAMSALQAVPQLADVYAFDRQIHRNLARTGFTTLEAATLASDLTAQSGSVIKSMGRILSAAALTRVTLTELPWSLHCVVESSAAELTQPALEAIDRICRQCGASPIPDTIPRVTRARPFRPIKALIGPDGERWLPCHGVFAPARAGIALQHLAQWQVANASGLQQHAIRLATLLASAGDCIIVEPQFFWPDSLSAFQTEWGQPDQVKQFAAAEANAAARVKVAELRAELRDLFGELGSGHLQVGKYYPWLSQLDAGAARLARALKHEMDPAGILNPGALGL